MPAFPRRRSIRLALLGVVLAVVAAGTYYYVDRRWPYYHFRTVEAGVFYRSSQLTADELEDAIDRYGFKTIVNLRTVEERARGTWYADERAVAARRGVAHLDVPMRGDQPPSPAQVPVLLEVLRDPARLPVLVHCEKGSIRSAAVEGLYRRELLGESGEEALDNVETWSHDLPATYPDIARFIRDYVPQGARR